MMVRIDDIRLCPAFADTVVEKIWRTWWQPKGAPRSMIEKLVALNLASETAQPFCLVAHEDGVFAGTASLIDSDVATRPEWTPWVAAVWVEPQCREQGVATELLATVTARAFELGESTLYLYCTDPMIGFYARRGWDELEAGVPEPGWTAMRMSRRMSPSTASAHQR